MPIYEYNCKKCGEFDVTQRITEPELKKCPTCGRKVTKLISHSAFHLKGTGWYATDYGKNGAKDTKDTSSSQDSKKDAKDTKSDTKGASNSSTSSSSSSKDSSSKSASPSTA